MAFNEIEKGEGLREALTNTVKFHTSKTVGLFTMSGDVFEKMGSPGFLRVLLGDGEHSGYVALIPRQVPGKNTYSLVPSGRCWKFAISARKIGVTAGKRPGRSMPFEITDDGLVVDLRSVRTVVRQHHETVLIKRENMVAAE